METVLLEPWEKVSPYVAEDAGVGILFAGSPTHEKIVRKYILPAIRKVHRLYPEIRILFVGYKDTSIAETEPYIDTTEWFYDAGQYREYVTGQRMQIGLAVIEDNEFGRCKFFNKYLEYSKLGIMGLYSACEPYTFAVTDGVNGILVNNTVEDWEATILRAVHEPALREQCVRNAQEDLMKKYTTEVVIRSVEQAIPEICEYAAPDLRVRFFYFLWLLNLWQLMVRCFEHPWYAIKRLSSKGREIFKG